MADKPERDTRKRICLLSDHHPCVNPRLWKEAFFYEKNGWEVAVLTMWQSRNFLQKDHEILKGHNIRYKAYLNLLPGEVKSSKRFFYRARKRAGAEMQRRLKKASPWAISHAPEKMLTEALKENADLYSAHLECAFYAGRKLVKAGKKVSFDFEDWYSRDYLVPGRPVKLLQSLEKFALQNGVFCTAASRSMADALEETYKPDKNITVIYNGFSVGNTKGEMMNSRIEKSTEFVPLLWFSRNIGPGRGIENLLQALPFCSIPVALHLLGEIDEGYKAFLEKEFAGLAKHKLVIHPFIQQEQLHAFISEFKIGLAIEEKINDNKRLTVSNKILQYLQAGLHVIASDTKGQKEVAEVLPSKVNLVDINNKMQLARVIDSLCDKTNLEKHQSNSNESIDTFNKIFSWEAQEKKLGQLIDQIL